MYRIWVQVFKNGEHGVPTKVIADLFYMIAFATEKKIGGE